MVRTVILGLGNPVVSDERVGLAVSRELQLHLEHTEIDVKEAYVGGLRLIDDLEGYDRAIIVDGASNMSSRVGDVQSMNLEHAIPTRHTGTTHDMDLLSALKFGREMGVVLPKTITVWGIEVKETELISEEMTDEVQASVPIAVKAILEELDVNRLEYAHEQEGGSK